MMVVMLASREGTPCAVLKLPLVGPAERGLQRETIALEALGADERLRSWRGRLAPRPLAHGNLDGQPYRLDTALAGQPPGEPGPSTAKTAAQLRAAVAAIGQLHELTASELPSESDRCAHWVDLHLHELESRSGLRGPALEAGRRLRRELHGAVCSWPGTAAAVHGDFWLGNLLFDERGNGGLTGIVDWESWGACELPFHDLLHLLLYARRATSGLELGEIVARHLQGGRWSAFERELLERHGSWNAEQPSTGRHALLLYWLRHAAIHARQQPRRPGYRYRLWERRNLLPVVAAL